MAWQPDDSFLDVVNGEMKGVTKVKTHLANHGRKWDKIYTSQDQDIDKIRQELVNEKAAPGFKQWQLPVALGPKHDVVAFMTVADPGAVVPSHAHKVEVFRLIVSGTAYYNGVPLTAGDWMVVPAGESYSLTAADNPGYVSYHLYW
jgi:quercetin dioxygenase-like cupin family protein